MDETPIEKIYVAIGYDVLDGFQTLDWALKKWNSHQNISLIILHVKYNPSNDHVYTLLGKLPAKGACEEKLERITKYEQNLINKLLSKYIALCGKVPAETFEVEKFDEPMQNLTIDLILGLGITKLVMGFSFMRPSMKSKDAMNGLFYVHQHKPDFCELYIICGGKQVSPRVKNDEISMEDENGVKVAKMRDYKINFKDWIEKILFCDKIIDSNKRSSSKSPTSSTNMEAYIDQNQWEFYTEEIDNYLQELLSLNLEEGSCGQDNDIDDSFLCPIEPYVQELKNSNDKSAAEKFEMLTDKLNEAYNTIQMKRKEEKDNLERHAKAEWAIFICNSREEELEYRKSKEVTRREELKKEINTEKEQIQNIRLNIEESKQRLSSLVELQLELQNKLHVSTLAVSECETKLENVMDARTKMLMEIEELSKQRDVFNKRIMFFKEKDVIEMSANLKEKSCSLREYTKEEIIWATNNFSEHFRLKSCGVWSNVYRGHINNSNVAIKMLDSTLDLSQQDFHSKLRTLGSIRHPHLVVVLGFCSEPKCLVLEYMHNGSLEEMLLFKAISWQDCIRIVIEVCSGLGFLNSIHSRPIIHCHPFPSNILLDYNLLAKIKGFGLYEYNKECNVGSDMKAIGVLLLHLLTGRGNWVTIDMEAFFHEIGEQWPFDVARELLGLAIRCMSMNCESNFEISLTRVTKELNEIRRKGCQSSEVPNFFLCPILQKVMRNPHIAADGFSYELEAIEEWLQSGNDISPTSLRLKNKLLFPNHNLRSLIQNWQSKTSTNKIVK